MKRALASLVVAVIVVGAAVTAIWLSRRTDGAGIVVRPSTGRPASSEKPTAEPTVRPTATSTPTATAKPTGTPTVKPPAGVPGRPKDAQAMKVTSVYDGDTIQLQAAKPGKYVTSVHKIKVRLIGVNAPEMTPTKQCYAQQATDRLRKLTPIGATVWVKPDRDSWDDYKRRLFLVWTSSGVLVDHELVRGGFGPAIRVYPNITYWPLFERTQAAALKARRGLWGAC